MLLPRYHHISWVLFWVWDSIKFKLWEITTALLFFPSKIYTFSTWKHKQTWFCYKRIIPKKIWYFQILHVIAFFLFDIKQQSKAFLKQLCSSHKTLSQLSNWRSHLNIVIESKVPQLSHFIHYVSGLKAQEFFWNSWGFACTCKWKTNDICPVLFWCNCGWIFALAIWLHLILLLLSPHVGLWN